MEEENISFYEFVLSWPIHQPIGEDSAVGAQLQQRPPVLRLCLTTYTHHLALFSPLPDRKARFPACPVALSSLYSMSSGKTPSEPLAVKHQFRSR